MESRLPHYTPLHCLRHWLVVGLILLSASFSARGEALDPADAVSTLIEKLNHIKTLHADFRQWVNDARQNALQDVTGTMWVSRPGMFRWDTDDPFPQRIVVNDDKVWVYDIDLEQVTERSMGAEVGNTPALLLTGDPAQLTEHFLISAYRYPENGEYRFELIPRGEDAMFELLRVHFREGVLVDMFLRDSLGQTTKIDFTNAELNQPVDTDIFTFSAPKDVDWVSDL